MCDICEYAILQGDHYYCSYNNCNAVLIFKTCDDFKLCEELCEVEDDLFANV